MPDVQNFHAAVKRGDLAGVQAALAESPEILDAPNASGQSAFLLAKYYGQKQIAEYLLACKPKLDIFTATVAGESERVREFLKDEPEAIHAHSSDGWTPLHLAAFFGYPELAASLLEHGAAIDARSTNVMTNTPMHAAVAGGHIAVVRLLAERGAKVNASQHGGWTALHGAAQAGRREIVEILIANGADLNARADNNQSPLDLALSNNRQEVAALLEQLGAKLT